MERTETSLVEENLSYVFPNLREATPEQIPNAVLARLIQEVKNDEILTTTSYNRFHNRHNR
ncbi:MAG: YhhA family cyclophane-containing RiPP [Pyrinomonadaceae bacterium]